MHNLYESSNPKKSQRTANARSVNISQTECDLKNIK